MIVTKKTFVNIVCLINMLGLTSVYFSKDRTSKYDNKYYGKLLIANIIGLIIHIITEYASYYYTPIISSIVFKSILIYYIIFNSIYLIYILEELKFKKNNVYMTLCKVICVFACMISVLLPEKFYGDNVNLIYYTYGPDVKITFIHGFSVVAIIILLFITQYKKIDKRKKKYMLMYFIGLFTGGIIQKIRPELSINVYVETLLCCMMYFTIENPDVEADVYMAAKNQAIKAGRAKDDFLSSMSHELRTPLNAIVGLSQMIEDETEKPTIKEDAKEIMVASQDLLELINSILNANKIENNKLDLVEEEYDLIDEIQTLIKMTNLRLTDKDIVFKTNISNDIPTKLFGDKEKIRTIITNLLSNSVKYTNNGTIELSVNSINKGDIAKLIITVKDTGRGISKEQQANLFTNFNRREEDKDSDIKGVGLGLAITKSFVDIMEGTIKVESEEDVGSAFIVKLDQKIIEQNNVEVL